MKPAIIVLLSVFLISCAAPGSMMAGIGASKDAPYGCGLFDYYTPETGTLDGKFTSKLTADAQEGSICD